MQAPFCHSLSLTDQGYRLSKTPKEYTIGMILRQVEGSLAPVSCLEDEVNTCERQSECVTLRIWKELNDAIKSVVDRYTLEDGRGRCVSMKQNILNNLFEKSLDNWYTSFYIILNPYQTDRKYMNLGKRRLLSWQTFIKEH